MMFRELDAVVLTRDVPEHALRAGDLGAIVHMHTDTMAEVEFVRATGTTAVVTTLPTSALRGLSDTDLLSVRPE